MVGAFGHCPIVRQTGTDDPAASQPFFGGILNAFTEGVSFSCFMAGKFSGAGGLSGRCCKEAVIISIPIICA
jgi:hypothetical protein